MPVTPTPPLSAPKCDECPEECGCGQGSGVCPASGSPEISFPTLQESAWAKYLPQIAKQKRAYSSQLSDGTTMQDAQRGYGWNILAEPYISEATNGDITVVLDACSTVSFEKDGTNFDPQYGAKQWLDYAPTAYYYTMTDCDGSKWGFIDYNDPVNPHGLFNKFISPGGDLIQVTSYTAAGRIGEVQRATGSGAALTTESWKYDYISSGVNADLVEYVTNKRTTPGTGTYNNIRRAKFTYYTGAGGEFGRAGDLQTAEEQVWDGSAWQLLRTWYMRYYKSGDANGFAHGLKYFLGPEAFARCPSPLTATDATVAGYADHYYEYDSSRRATKSVVNAGERTYLFSYADNTDDPGYNNWRRKTTITRPDGTLEIVYTNHIAQELLREHRDGTRKWITYHVYGTDADSKPGLLLKQWTPKAVASYVDNGGANSKKIVVTGNTTGRINEFDYATSTTATTSTPGDAKGFLKLAQVKDGSGGTAIKQRELKYIKRTVNSRDIFVSAELKTFRDDAGTGAITTAWAYEWHGAFQFKTRTTTLPAIPTSQNGSGTSNLERELFDTYGNRTATQDGRGFIDTRQFDIPTGGLLKIVQDDAAPSGSGWTANGGMRLLLTTDFEVDALGRQAQELSPVHTIDVAGSATSIRSARWTVHKDQANETWTGRGYQKTSDSSFTLIDPVQIAKTDDDGRVTARISSKRTTGSGKLAASDTFAQTDWSRWTAEEYNDKKQHTATRVYHTIPASGNGSSGTNYSPTMYGYETSRMARRNRVLSPGNTITRTVFDVRGNVLAVYVGTNDTGATDGDPDGSGSPNNMLPTVELEFDGGAAGGNGNRTKSTARVNITAGNDRVTTFEFDFRDRQIKVNGEIDYFVVTTFDNLNQPVKVERYNGDDSSSANRVAQSETRFDDLGRVYQRAVFAVTVGGAGSGNVGNALTDNTWFDAAGNVAKEQPAGSKQFVKTAFDSVNRPTGQYRGYYTGAGTESYADSLAVTSSNKLFQQTLTEFDAAGNAILAKPYDRFHNATGNGVLQLATGSEPKARVSFVAMYPDAIGRTAAVADYGTNNNAAFSRSTTIPARSDDVLVASTGYNVRGEAFQTFDPKNTETRREWDHAARRTKLIENYVSGGTNDDQNRTTQWTYNADSRVLTMKAINARTGDQTTSYGYGVTVGGGSTINSNDLLRSKTYPDFGVVTRESNRQGEAIKLTDQNGTVHTLVRDKLGRQPEDQVTTVGSGVDGAVRRIGRTFDPRGLPLKVTSYDAATGGAVVNEIEFTYNSFAQPTIEYQEHGGAVNQSTSPKVQYAYADGSANTIRRTETKYPNGNQLFNMYSGTDDGSLTRISSLDFGGNAVSYTRMGVNNIVQLDYPDPSTKWDLITGSGANPYAGLDRFGRVIDNLWQTYVGPTVDLDRIEYGYDRAGNRTWRKNVVAATNGKDFDELYGYDGLYQLKDFDRGNLTGTPPSGITSLTFAQEWANDPTGNWRLFKQNDDGGASWDLEQTRTHNTVNEITDITNTVGSAWIDPVYDNNGNMTTMPQPATPTASYTATYDAWNRLINIASGGTNVAANAYDGLNRRTKKTVGGTPRHYYYSDNWQIIEERVGSSTSADRQFVWGIRYIDDLVCRDIAGDRLFAMQDANWNVTGLVDTTSAVAERYSYDAYGISTVLNPDFTVRSAGSSFAWETRFAGYRSSSESNLYYVRYRDLHSVLGRWAQRDPSRSLVHIGNTETHPPIRLANLYDFCEGNPLVLLDSNGLFVAPTFGPFTEIPGFGQFCADLADPCTAFDREELTRGLGWLVGLPDCPCGIVILVGNNPINKDPNIWEPLEPASQTFHPGADWCMRSKPTQAGGPGQQCCYKGGALLTGGLGAGSPDLIAPTNVWYALAHYFADVAPHTACLKAGRIGVYLTWRPPNNGNNCTPLIFP